MRSLLVVALLPLAQLIAFGFARWLSRLLAPLLPTRWHRVLFRDYVTGELKVPPESASARRRA